MNREQLIEKAARASHQWGLELGGEWAEWDELRESTRREYRDEAAFVVDALLAEVDRLREELEAFKGAAADLAQAGIAERDALRKVVALLSNTEVQP